MPPGPEPLLPLQGNISASWHLVSLTWALFLPPSDQTSQWYDSRNQDRTQHNGNVLQESICSSQDFRVLPLGSFQLMRTEQKNDNNPSLQELHPRGCFIHRIKGSMYKSSELKSTKASPILLWWHTSQALGDMESGRSGVGSKPALAT